MKLRYTPLALAEIDRIFVEMAIRSPRGARNVRNRLRGVANSVRHHPYIGQRLSASAMRRIALSPYPYLLFYRVTDIEIVVIGLRHAARDPASMPDESEASRPSDLP